MKAINKILVALVLLSVTLSSALIVALNEEKAGRESDKNEYKLSRGILERRVEFADSLREKAEVLVIDYRSKLAKELRKSTKIRKPETIGRIAQDIRITEVPLHFTDRIAAADTSAPDTTRFESNGNDYYKIVGRTTGWVAIDSVGFRQVIQNAIGEDKPKGILSFLKSSKRTSEVSTDNPYVTITGLEFVDLTRPKYFFEKKWFVFTVGVAAGGYITYRIMK